MQSHFASVFLEQRFSDADLCLQVLKPASDDATHSEPQEVARFPVHLVVLTQSPYFASQVNFLSSSNTSQAAATPQDAAAAANPSQHMLQSTDSTLGSRKRLRLSIEVIEDDVEGATRAAGARTSSGRCDSSRLQVVLTIDDQSHDAATMAVIAAMYGVEDLLSSLQQPELVYAVKYADLLQMASTTEAALGLLITAAETPQGLTEDTLAVLAGLPVWPSCMFTLLPKVTQAVVLDSSKLDTPAAPQTNSRNASIQAVLVTVLGHLENVWQQEELKGLLLGLPLAAMLLLLSSDKLAVYSEDTVLYTACKFVAHGTVKRKARAAKRLSELIRVPQLSDLQQIIHAMSPYPGELDAVLTEYFVRIQHLLSLKRFELSTEEMLAQLRRISAGRIPDSWGCGSRQILAVPSRGVNLTWEVSVDEVKGAILRCQETKTAQSIESSASPPLAGLEWRVGLKCSAEANGVQISLSMVVSYPGCSFKNAFCKYDYHFQVPSVGFVSHGVTSAPLLLSNNKLRWKNPFKLSMSDGWDEAAWVATGLPASGRFDVILSIVRVH